MKSDFFRSGLRYVVRRARCGAEITGVLALAAFTVLATTAPVRAEGRAAASQHLTAVTPYDTARKPSVRANSLSATARRALRQARLERKSAERALARLRTFQRDARAAGLPTGRAHERSLAAALRHQITLLRDYEQDLTRGAPGTRHGVQKRAPAAQKPSSKPRGSPPYLPGESAEGTTYSGSAKGRRAKAVAYARAQLGKPYRWGGTGPGSFDCSGLVMRAWQHAGVEIPRITTTQWRAGTHIKRSQLQPGDLVFRNDRGHVMLYAGNGRVIHASRPGTPIRYAPLPPHSQVNGYVTVLPRGGTR
jgi:cell wall-associated NlpC family hydrolase